jgi:hypothetical protein
MNLWQDFDVHRPWQDRAQVEVRAAVDLHFCPQMDLTSRMCNSYNGPNPPTDNFDVVTNFQFLGKLDFCRVGHISPFIGYHYTPCFCTKTKGKVSVMTSPFLNYCLRRGASHSGIKPTTTQMAAQMSNKWNILPP